MSRSNGIEKSMNLRKPDLHLLVFGLAAIVFLAFGAARVFRTSFDFVPVYSGARCLLHGCNPYDTKQLEEQFFAGGGQRTELPSWEIDMPVYPPSTFLTLSPLATLPFPAARLVWFLMNGSLFVTSAGLILSLCAGSQRWLATALVSAILATSGILLVLGQPAAFSISLVMIGCYLFFRNRLLPLGALAFMLSLAVKPQIGGLIPLYFLVRRIHWRYAAVAMVGALVLLLSGGSILRQHPGSRNWASTLQANLASTLSPGGSADPRPANIEAVGDINLQTLTSIFLPGRTVFNATAYAIFLILAAALALVVLRVKATPESHFLALAAVSILSLMPIYHRFYDTRLLLLSTPGILIIFQRRRLMGAVIAILTLFAVVSVQYRVQVFLLQRAEWQSLLQNKLLFILLLRQQNLELLMLFALYLCAIVSLCAFSAPEMEKAPTPQAATTLPG
jgi:hypothetical protein